jgi:hypothetical protein
LSIPRVDRWPFSNMMSISFADISRFIIKLHQIGPDRTTWIIMMKMKSNSI